MREKFQRFMMGRYGADQLSKFMLVLVFIAIIVNLFVKSQIPFFIALVLLIISYFRMFSRNYAARQKENQKYLKIKYRVQPKFKGIVEKIKNLFGKGKDPNHKIYKCPSCKQKIRVPKGRGLIEITCPKCGGKFRKRT